VERKCPTSEEWNLAKEIGVVVVEDYGRGVTPSSLQTQWMWRVNHTVGEEKSVVTVNNRESVIRLTWKMLGCGG
jgi:hypothetical protein